MSKQKNRTAYLAIMLTVCLIFGYIESVIPLNLGFPGAKIGICNIVILLMLKRDGLFAALSINILRILITNILFVGVFSLSYALPAGIISTLLMYSLLKFPTLSSLSVSAAGGAAHNLVQALVASVMLSTPSVFTYFAPFLLLLGMAAGIVCGIATELIFRRLKKAGL